MDLPLEKVSLPFFLWFVLPGLNCCLVNVALPMVIYRPDVVTGINGAGNAVAILFMSLTLGFVIDSLKLYQFTIGYRGTGDVFFRNLSQALYGEHAAYKSEVKAVDFELIREIIKANQAFASPVSIEHSKWVMISITSKLFFIFAAELAFCNLFLTLPSWASSLAGAVRWYPSLPLGQIILALIALFAVLVGWRLGKNAKRHRLASNRMYLRFAQEYRDMIIEQIAKSRVIEDNSVKEDSLDRELPCKSIV
jgi:hypothetical protein